MSLLVRPHVEAATSVATCSDRLFLPFKRILTLIVFEIADPPSLKSQKSHLDSRYLSDPAVCSSVNRRSQTTTILINSRHS